MNHNWENVVWENSPPSILRRLGALSVIFEKINSSIGRTVAWLSFAMVLLGFGIVVARYGLNIGSVKLQESVVYMHALVFMLCGAYCLQQGHQVRIDVLYSKLSTKRQTQIDLFGTLLFLLPACFFIFYLSLDYVSASWGYKETSRDIAGLEYLYLLKTLLLVMPLLIFAQGLADLTRCCLFLTGWISYKDSAHSEGKDFLDAV